jgi:DNA-binding transcriptional regulator YbjK
MKLSDFIMLNEEEKKLAVLHRGVLISKRSLTGYIVFLFQLNNFYVETFGDTKTKKVIQYQAFDNTKLLNPYLENIAIDDVFSR